MIAEMEGIPLTLVWESGCPTIDTPCNCLTSRSVTSSTVDAAIGNCWVDAAW